MHKILSQKLFIISMCLIFIIGLGYIFALYFILNPQVPKENLITSQPVTHEPVSSSLDITSPNDNLLVFNEDLLIYGNTSLGNIIIISSDTTDSAIYPNSDGNFSLTYKLTPGINDLTINAFDKMGNNKKEERMVYFSKEKI
ncbi:MAG: hypothetical protein Q7R43_05940 [Candidatus Daviesbacteria bacterium]|nr:hypothetical protein [Candidatus Daviesbacteria bacterium]